ncbi:AAA family ATPase [Deinococcus humi]|uniref:Energy-coupling factor transporter ATP-binding protein EcfA2 n=1 Tax=Deinococcus humi TaxID=662880 RepID=A0A7W8JXM8_9DEIO|nr:energy-coupling factor transporter ATP-binding protein EcfA2 [Deinococcus humi]
MSASLPLPHLRPDSLTPEAEEQSLGQMPLTVLVGVTGVGKSTALNALQSLGGHKVLPNRREVTDAVMIWPLAGRAVTDREERFALTAQYRAAHPGGMAQALGSLLADTRYWGHAPLFDGLRGLDEVRYAARNFPGWRFVALGAPDAVRVRRLLGRSDGFDQVAGTLRPDGNLRAELGKLSGVSAVFNAEELDALAALEGPEANASGVLAKVRIVLSERRQYDPAAAEAFLRTLPPQRALILDTVALTPAQVARAVQDWA